MYQDIAAKIAFHKERIIKSFIKKGVYPNDTQLAAALANIDTSLAYLQTEKAIEGEYVDVAAFNAMMDMIMRDLQLLYQLLYTITVQEYVTLKAFVDTHLDELEDTANLYKLKAEQEANSTSLGKTMLFKTTGFDLYTQNGVTVVDLGSVSLNKGSRVACFLNANNIEADKIVFGLKQGDSDPLYVSAYNYNQDTIVIPGTVARKTYATSFSDDQILTSPIEMDLQGNKANDNNHYYIMGGKNSILVKKFSSSVSEFVEEAPTALTMLSFDKKSYIDFYVVGGNSVTFRFNKRPVSTNFSLSDYKVSGLDYIHHFFIEAEEGFAFDFELDGGTIYAVKENGVVKDEKVYFARSLNVRDFLVVEYATGDPDTYSAFVKVYNDDGAPIDIESVMIKELVAIGDDQS